MSPIYVPGKLTLRKEYIGTDDPDAQAYIAAVEAADEAASPGVGALELGVKVAIHSFVKGCKQDGTWSAIKASCILAGARTLDGALVPLVGAAPTSFNFVAGDYNRETGLTPNGDAAKWIDSNYSNQSDSRQDNNHQAVWVHTSQSAAWILGNNSGVTGSTALATSSVGNYTSRNMHAASALVEVPRADNVFVGSARSSSDSYTVRAGNTNEAVLIASESPASGSIGIFRRSATGGNESASSRFTFYSLGNSLDLALLDARVTNLVNAIGAAIP